MRFPSNSIPGNDLGLAPVAMIIFSVSMVSILVPILTDIELGETRRPVPLICLILFFFIKNSMPLLRRSDTSRLRFTLLLKSTLNFSTFIPYLSACFIRLYTSAFFNSAFVGMQPQFKHIPPSLSLSMTQTFWPNCAPRIAATYPPGPPPNTARSNLGINLIAY